MYFRLECYKTGSDFSNLGGQFMEGLESNKGLEISDKYNVNQFPATLFLDYNGKVLGRLKGFYPPEYFIKILAMNQSRRRGVINKEENFDELIMSM